MVIRRLISFLVMMGIPWLGYGANWDYAVYGSTEENTVSVESARMQLYAAAATGNEAQVEEALAVIPIDTPDQTGNSALCESVWKNNPKAFYLLRSYGASVNAPCVQNIPNSQRIIFNEAAAAYAAQIQATYGAQQAAATAATTQTDSGAVVASAGGGQTKATAAGAVSYEKRPIYPPKDKGIAAGTWVTGVGVVALIAGGIALALLIGGGGGGSDKSSGGSGSSSGSSGSSSSGGDDCGHGTMQGHDCQCDEGWGYDAARKCTVPLSCDGYSYETHVIPNCKKTDTCWSGDVPKYGCKECNDGWVKNTITGGCVRQECEGYVSDQKINHCLDAPCDGKYKTVCTQCESGYSGTTCQPNDCTEYPSSSATITGCTQTESCTPPEGTTKYQCAACSTGYTLKNGLCEANDCGGFPSSSATITGCTQTESCTPVSGSVVYRCTSCSSDYILVDGQCQEKSPSDCSGHGVKEGDTCSCVDGWEGDNCETEKTCGSSYSETSCASPYICGRCRSGDTTYYTKPWGCQTGYRKSGITTTWTCVPDVVCGEHQIVVGTECVCAEGYKTGTDGKCSSCANGYHLDVQTGRCYLNLDCGQHGRQVEGFCNCDAGYEGDSCQNCAMGYQEDNYICVRNENMMCAYGGSIDTSTNTCACEDGFEGERCTECLGYSFYGHTSTQHYGGEQVCVPKTLCGDHGTYDRYLGSLGKDPCTCDTGWVTTNTGECSYCNEAAGYKIIDGQCRRKLTCGVGQEQQEDACVPKGCQGGEVAYDGNCYDPLSCGEHGVQIADVCVCEKGYIGTTCSEVTEECSGHGKLEQGQCVCETGYIGNNCDTCSTGYIEHEGVCYPSLQCGMHQVQLGGTCVCETGYDDNGCTACVDGYTHLDGGCFIKLNCNEDLNHGKQVGSICVCNSGWTGPDCSVQGDKEDYLKKTPGINPKNEDPKAYQTNEFKGQGQGVNFLGAIKADEAYARGYTGYIVERDTDGYLLDWEDEAYKTDDTGKKVKVKAGIIDGVFNSWHVDLEDNIAQTRNFDYGPCRGTDKTHCYAYVGDENVGNMVFYNDGEDDTEIIQTNIGKQSYIDAFAGYAEDYDWDEENIHEEVTASPEKYARYEELAEKTERTPEEESEFKNLYLDLNHGTHVAGILGALKNNVGMHGVVPNVDMYLTSYNQKTPKDYVEMLWFKKAMENYADNNVGVVNLSWGIGESLYKDEAKTQPVTFEDVQGHEAEDFFPTSYVDGFKIAANNNMVIVQAAGNESGDEPIVDAFMPLTSTFAKQGGGSYLDNLYLTVVSVVYDSSTETWGLAEYSNKCGMAGAYCLAAPGGNSDQGIFSTLYTTDWGNMAGTSMATPMVTGAVALLQSAYPNLTSQQVVYLLLHTADSLGDMTETGMGLINLEKATQPYGDLGFDLDSVPTNSGNPLPVGRGGGQVATSSFAVPLSLRANMMAVLPKAFTAFDALNRPYEMPTSMLFKDTKNQKTRIFKKDFKAFRMQSMQGEVRTSDRLNFKFSNPVLGNNPSVPWGSLKMAYDPTDRLTIGFNYAEHTLYQTGDYFKKNLENPFFKMKEAYGVGAELRLGSKINVSLQYMAGKNGFYVDEDDEDAYDNAMMGVEMKVSHKITPKLTLGASVGMLDERHAVLGMTGTDAFDPTKTRTYLGGLHLGYDLTPDLAFGMAYYRGYTRTNGHTDVLSFTDIQSEALSFNMTYRLKKARVGLDLTSPLRIRRGNALFDIPVGRHPTDDIVYRRQYRASLRPAAREWDISAFYNRMISDSLNFQTKWGVRLNPEHQKGASPDYFGLFNMNWMY